MKANDKSTMSNCPVWLFPALPFPGQPKRLVSLTHTHLRVCMLHKAGVEHRVFSANVCLHVCVSDVPSHMKSAKKLALVAQCENILQFIVGLTINLPPAKMTCHNDSHTMRMIACVCVSEDQLACVCIYSTLHTRRVTYFLQYFFISACT